MVFQPLIGIKCLCLHVADTGSGIDEVFLPHLFDPFQQESKGWERSHEGTGLGLPITRLLVEKMEGRIDVKSDKGRGTRFTVRFPTASAGEKEDRPTELPGTAQQQEPEQRQPRLLIVEDNDDTRFLMRTLLEEVGNVEVAATAEAALEAAQRRDLPEDETKADDRTSRAFDLSLVDINLGPGKSGMDLLKELRALPAYRDTPLVAVTGYALPGDRERLLETGFDAYVAKPFDPQELLDLATRLLKP